MKKIMIFCAAVLTLTACSNSETKSTTTEHKDSTVVKESTANPDNNTVTPPASNGQY